MLLILFIATLCSFVASILLVHYKHMHARFSADSDLTGVQKFHAVAVPRIGGIPIFLGMLLGILIMLWLQRDDVGLVLLLVTLPAFGAGLIEDLTKRVGVPQRLLATFVSALLGAYLLHAMIQRVDIPFADHFLHQYWVLSLLFSMAAIGGVAHSINIIDGYNGLSGMVVLLIFTALAYVAFKVNDTPLLAISFACCGGVIGFLLLNYPLGLIFAGDGGAYLMGIMIAEISVLLVVRNPQVSAWFPLLLVIYPVFETLFSMYRRKFLQDKSFGCPDSLHLHQVVYKRLVRWMVGSKEICHMTRRNSLTAPYLWVLASLSVAPAMLFWAHPHILMLCTLLFVLLYLHLYRMLIHFKSPTWLVLSKKIIKHRN
jgi:UDP-N-acetylmuramyl pentapeptide phosphotransferase/UDP-N-acetylglucosamine-1-phosphate transferase